jgi:hypothetical protein
MPTAPVLHPIAQARLSELPGLLENDFGVEISQRTLVSALVYCATPAMIVGMQIEFVKARKAYEEGQALADAEDDLNNAGDSQSLDTPSDE